MGAIFVPVAPGGVTLFGRTVKVSARTLRYANLGIKTVRYADNAVNLAQAGIGVEAYMDGGAGAAGGRFD